MSKGGNSATSNPDMVPESEGDDTGTNCQLPQYSNLPQWSRINNLDKTRYPKPIPKDRLLRHHSTAIDDDTDVAATEAGENANGGGFVASPDGVAGTKRIQHLEKSIQFLQVQHQEVLANLHNEIDKLKRENKDLQFKIIMVQKSSPPGTSMSRSATELHQPGETAFAGKGTSDKDPATMSASTLHSAKCDDMAMLDRESLGTDSKLEELRVILLEEEVREVRRQLKEEKSRNGFLGHLLQQAEKQKLLTQQHMVDQAQVTKLSTKMPLVGAKRVPCPRLGAGQLPFNASIVPLQVRIPQNNPRPPTMSECEVIIQHLQHMNDKQAHELNQLKTDLRDVLYSHKWSPDAYLLAKAYVAEDDAKGSPDAGNRLPRIPFKQQARKLPDIAYIQRDTVTLPALKQTMGNKAIERRKRTQVLQRSRLVREVLP